MAGILRIVHRAWCERLEELDQGKVPAEPRLQAAADELLTRTISGASLAELENGWASLLEEEPDVERVADRGAKLFALASSLLGSADPKLDAAGRIFGLASARRRGLLGPLAPTGGLRRHRFPAALRPLTAMAALAARDLQRGKAEPEATPGRAWALLRHRLTGRLQ